MFTPVSPLATWVTAPFGNVGSPVLPMAAYRVPERIAVVMLMSSRKTKPNSMMPNRMTKSRGRTMAASTAATPRSRRARSSSPVQPAPAGAGVRDCGCGVLHPLGGRRSTWAAQHGEQAEAGEGVRPAEQHLGDVVREGRPPLPREEPHRGDDRQDREGGDGPPAVTGGQPQRDRSEPHPVVGPRHRRGEQASEGEGEQGADLVTAGEGGPGHQRCGGDGPDPDGHRDEDGQAGVVPQAVEDHRQRLVVRGEDAVPAELRQREDAAAPVPPGAGGVGERPDHDGREEADAAEQRPAPVASQEEPQDEDTGDELDPGGDADQEALAAAGQDEQVDDDEQQEHGVDLAEQEGAVHRLAQRDPGRDRRHHVRRQAEPAPDDRQDDDQARRARGEGEPHDHPGG